MKHLFSAIVLLILCMNAVTQETRDALYLKNESIIRGNIIEKDSTRVKIETCCGSLFVFPYSEIEKIEKEVYKADVFQIKEFGYLNITSLGSLIGSGTNTKAAPFSFISEHNMRLHKHFILGASLGYELLNEAVMPVGISVKAVLPHKHNLLLAGINGGYSISIENPDENFFTEAKGGIYMNSELGIILPISSNTGFFMALGYRYSELNYKREDWWLGDVDRKVHYKRLSVRLGLSFY